MLRMYRGTSAGERRRGLYGLFWTREIAEAKKCALGCRYYADHAEEYLADEPLEADRGRSYIRHLPIGPVLAIMPWNFPFWQVFRFAAPSLMAGRPAWSL